MEPRPKELLQALVAAIDAEQMRRDHEAMEWLRTLEGYDIELLSEEGDSCWAFFTSPTGGRPKVEVCEGSFTDAILAAKEKLESGQ